MNHNLSAGSTVAKATPGTRPSPPPSGSGHYPLARLLQLVTLLQTERCPNARELAEACEVSRRTIYRDFSTLAAAGIAVNYASDRQGYQLARNVFLQPTRLLEKEALALLLVSRTWDGGGTVGLARLARLAVDKVLQGLPHDLRTSVGNCAELLPELSDGDDPADIGDPMFDKVLAAMSSRRQIRLWYRSRGRRAAESEVETTKLSLYRMPRVRGAWALVGRSSFHRRVIMVPFHWIEKIEPTPDSYVIPPRFQLKRFLDQDQEGRERECGEVVLKLRGGLAGRIDDLPWKGPRRVVAADRDGVEIALRVSPDENLAAAILAFGDELEVIGPEKLRRAVGGLAAQIARRYDAPPHAETNFVVSPPFGGDGG